MSDAVPVVDFDTTPEHYRHWTLATEGDVATSPSTLSRQCL